MNATIIPSDYQPSRENRYTYYEFLHFIPEDQKDKFWAAQVTLFNKFNSEPLVDPKKAVRYREIDQSILDKQKYVQIIDPLQPDGTGGTAEFFATDWKANPIDIKLANQLEAKLDKLGLSINVKAADEYFKTKQQIENDRIMGRKKFLAMLNDLNKQIGLPPLREDEDPYRYVERMQAAAQQGEIKTADRSGSPTTAKDMPISLLDNIRAMVEDNEDLALYNEYVYKDGVEVACELASQYYMDVNKFPEVSDPMKADLRNFRAASMRFYTSMTTGRPVLEYMDPATTWTQPFKRADGADCGYWWREYDVTFGEFVRQFGANLSREELKIIFERNRNTRGTFGVGTIPTWDECTVLQRENSLIRIGYMEVQTQNMAVYGTGTTRGNFRFKQMPADWEPAPTSPYKKEARYYNCWYKWYYIPLFANVGNTVGYSYPSGDFDMQAQYIFDFGKLQDQLREGDDQRYARSSLVVWRQHRPSWTDIKERFMTDINLLRLQMQNDIANAWPHGVIFNEDAFTELMGVVDEAQKDGKDGQYEVMRKLRQTGTGIFRFIGEDGKPLTPFQETRTGHLATAMERLQVMMNIYNLMTQALGTNAIGEGMAPAPRQNLGGIELSLQASDNANYYIEKAFTDIYAELGYRLINYFKDVVSYGPSERLQEFEDIVGRASAWSLEAIKEIPWRKMGITVDAINDTDRNMFVNQMALEMSKGPNPLITPDEAIGLTFIENVKYKFALMRLRLKKRRRQMEEQQAQQQQMMLQVQQARSAFEMEKINAQAQGKIANTELMKQMDGRLMILEDQLKHASQSDLKRQIKDNRIEENAATIEMEENQRQQRPLI